MNDLLEHYTHSAIHEQNGEKLYLLKAFVPPKFCNQNFVAHFNSHGAGAGGSSYAGYA
jgi:hypothetical protein